MREPRKAKIDLVSICNRTYTQKTYFESYVDRGQKMFYDADRKARLEECCCVMCYVPYGAGRIGGCAMTSVECAFCDTVKMFGSTCTDVLCVPCAKKNGLCKHCGADIDLKQRRKKRPFQEKA
jgi:hypothetical protein